MDLWACIVTVTLGFIYVSLGAGRILLTRLSSNDENKYEYLPVTVNVCAEAVKLLVCSVLSFRLLSQEGRSVRSAFHTSWYETLRLMKWSVPGLLYFMDNLIGFFVISYFDPALVVLLNNFVIISTSLLFRVVLKRKLSSIQWASLVVLFLGIVSLSNQTQRSGSSMHFSHPHIHHSLNITTVPINAKCNSQKLAMQAHLQKELMHLKEVTVEEGHEETWMNQRLRRASDDERFVLNRGHVLVLLQCFIASSANIYNEKIFKEDHGMEESIYIQNSKLYMFGVGFNSLWLLINKNYRRRIFQCGIFDGYNQYATLLIFVCAFQGLTISLILKFRDNMFHVLSQQVVTVLVITLAVFFTGFKPSLDFFLQAPTVLIAIFIYNKSKETMLSESEEQESCRTRRHNGMSVTEEELVDLTRRLSSTGSDEETI